ncbi:hypothetical protein TNCV_2790531 [Trichonephila clavipes]|nr:hypothetical protein TNCV_2790531 [Trichonephila clavipes]
MGNSGHCWSNPDSPGESRGCCPLSPNHRSWCFGGVLNWVFWLQTRSARSVAMPEWMETICPNALDSMNTQLTTSSVDTGRLGVKYSSRCV